MAIETIKQELTDGGLHKPSVNRLLRHYQSMALRFQESEYDEAGTHIGNFCENMVNILRSQMGESIQKKPDVGTFVDECLSGKIGTGQVDSIRLQIPRTLRATYDIRNNRDSVHVNLQVPVNKADTQAGIAMCSWMLAEILREYGAGSQSTNMENIASLINDISEPVSDRNPLQGLVTSEHDFDREKVLSALNGLVQIIEETGEVKPDSGFTELSTRKQYIVLLLGRRAAVDLGIIGEPNALNSWCSGHIGVTPQRIGQLRDELDFVEKEPPYGSAYIPGYRVEEALAHLE